MATANYNTTVTNNMTGVKTTPDGNWSSEYVTDPTVRSTAEAGYRKIRGRFSKLPKRYSIRYTGLTTHDKDLIATFEDDNYGAYFYWNAPDTGTGSYVIFASTVSYRPINNTNHSLWTVEFTVEQTGLGL